MNIRNRTNIINALIQKYSYSSYLEIGVAGLQNFKTVKCIDKHGVDPRTLLDLYTKSDTVFGTGHKLTSDEYFNTLHEDVKFDLIFIDGMHTHEQAGKDIANSFKHLNENGTIVMHDCSPETAFHERENGAVCGTTWRAFYEARKKYNIEAYVVDCDYGVGVIRRSDIKSDLPELNDSVLNYSFLDAHRKDVLNLISTDEFKQKIMSTEQAPPIKV